MATATARTHVSVDLAMMCLGCNHQQVEVGVESVVRPDPLRLECSSFHAVR
jgi:hypothetical protein